MAGSNLGKEDIAGGMRQHLNEVQTQNISGGGQAGQGDLLYTVDPDRKRIGLEMLIRLAVSVFAMVIFIAQNTETQLLIVTAAVLLVVILWPLRHWQDGMELHRGGVVYRGTFYPVGGKVTWVGARIGFLPSTFLGLSSSKRRIDVSFMKDAEKLFARAYDNVIT